MARERSTEALRDGRWVNEAELLGDPAALLGCDLEEEVNVAYVAATRATECLYVGPGLADWLEYAGVPLEGYVPPAATRAPPPPSAFRANDGAGAGAAGAGHAASATAPSAEHRSMLEQLARRSGRSAAAANVAVSSVDEIEEVEEEDEVRFEREVTLEERNAAGFANAIMLDEDEAEAEGEGEG